MTLNLENASINLWGDHQFTKRATTEVSQLCTNHRLPTRCTASINHHSEWAYERAPTEHDDSCPVRFVWVPNNPEPGRTNLDVTAEIFTRALKDLGLTAELAPYKLRCGGVFKHILEDPETASFSTADKYCFSYHPKLAVIWRVDINTAITSAVILATPQQLEKFWCLTEQKWQPWRHPMMPAYLTASLLGIEIDEVHYEQKKVIRKVEARTKHHYFEIQSDAAAEGGYQALSASMSACETKLAATTRKIRVLDDLLRYMIARCEEYRDAGKPTAYENDKLLASVEEMQRHLALRSVDNDYTLERVRVQSKAILSIISQYDASSSIDLARQSQAIAKHSQRNSASMMTLAVVTIIFLPCTFVAALFSMPLFDWNNGRDVVLPQFRVYWAVALPLTLVTLLVYGLWGKWYSVRNETQIQRDLEAAREEGKVQKQSI